MDPGEVILRPSSSGKVALTWAFRQNVYRHVEIDETEKKYKIDEEEYEVRFRVEIDLQGDVITSVSFPRRI